MYQGGMTAKVEADKRSEEAMLGTAPMPAQEGDKEVHQHMHIALHSGASARLQHMMFVCLQALRQTDSYCMLTVGRLSH
jgi:hypothetical protein